MIKLKYSLKDFKIVKLTSSQTKELINSLDPEKEIKKDVYSVKNFGLNNWFKYIDKYSQDIAYICVHKEEGLIKYRCQLFSNEIKEQSINAIKEISERFKKRTNVTFKKAFGTAEKEFLRCVPKQLYYSVDKEFFGLINSVDYSSDYPSQLCTTLPDSNTSIRLEGTVAPNEEYPFAYYINSGHMAIYNELDTHKWLLNIHFQEEDMFRYKTFNKFYDDLFHEELSGENDITILMKASKYNLKPEYEHFYELKDVDDSAKRIMNKSIGQMHKRKYDCYKYAHLAAVSIARANQKMFNLVKEIGFKNIIQIQVDGVLYTGENKYGVEPKEKYLGSLVQEAYQYPCRWKQFGCYMIKNKYNIYKVKHLGFSRMSDGRDIEKSSSFEDMDLWCN